MIMLSRLLLAAVAALFLLIGTGLLFNATEAAAGMEVVDITAAGRGTVRADIAGFFLGGAPIQLAAVIRTDPSLLYSYLALALAGVATMALDGPIAAGVVGMAVEITILLLGLYKRLCPNSPAERASDACPGNNGP